MATQAPVQNQQKKKSSASFWPLIMVALLIVVAGPTALILFFGMMPTIVAFLVDRTRQKYGPLCVTGMNFCGVFPVLLELWTGEHSFSAAFDLLVEPMMLLMMYGAAAFGWVLFLAVPPVIASFIGVVMERRIVSLRNVQKKIVDEWGDEVARVAKDKLG